MEKLTPQQAQQILKRNGEHVSIEQAALILAFLEKMAKIIIDNYKRKVKEEYPDI